jgi:hypothetical protein
VPVLSITNPTIPTPTIPTPTVPTPTTPKPSTTPTPLYLHISRGKDTWDVGHGAVWCSDNIVSLVQSDLPIQELGGSVMTNGKEDSIHIIARNVT